MDDVLAPWWGVFEAAWCILVPDCYFAFDHWLLVMGVPLAAAVAGGLLLRRWRNVLLAGAFSFIVHVAGQQMRSYLLDGELYYPRGVPFTIVFEFALLYCIVMTVVACAAHAARRLLL
jgi:hypothetical protein